MAKILVNGVKSKAGGGRTILNNYLGFLAESGSRHDFVVLTPCRREYMKYSRPNIEIVDVTNAYKHNFLFPLLYGRAIPKLLRAHRVEVIINFGDIVIPSALPQLYLFDWAFAVYSDPVVWEQLDFLSYVAQRVKLQVFQRYLKHATVVAAQTSAMKARLEAKYSLTNITVVPNAVPRENLGGGQYFDFGLPQHKAKLLYLTYYYPHKNLEVLLPVARQIRDGALPYQIVTTIAADQHPKAAAFLKAVRDQRLEDVVRNVGPVAIENVPSLYAQCDALLMPTLIESFSGAYLEAMFHEKVILTSKLDFAEDVCGDAAIYFDPFDSESILRAIEVAFGSSVVRHMKVDAGRSRLRDMPSWKQIFERYQLLLDALSERERISDS